MSQRGKGGELTAPVNWATSALEVQPWIAIYTCSRQEKMVVQHLRHRMVECFLPLYTAMRDWNGRRAEVQLPLFPGYVFARVPAAARSRVLAIPGIVGIVSFGGKPAVIGDDEMEAVRTAVALGKAEPWPWIVAGQRVRVKAGALAGLEGIVCRRKNRLRVVIALNAIMRAMSLEVDVTEIERVRAPGSR